MDSLSECVCASLEMQLGVMNGQHAFEKITLDEITAGKRFTLGAVRFDFNKALIRDSSLTELKRLRDYLVLNPAIRITVYGHTDDAGTPLHNQTLSEARASG